MRLFCLEKAQVNATKVAFSKLEIPSILATRGNMIAKFLLTALMCGMICANLSGAPITGTFNIVGTMTLTPTGMSWPLQKAAIDFGATGDFAPLAGTVISVFDSPFLAGSGPSAPYLAFDEEPSFPTLNLLEIFPGVFDSTDCAAAASVGQTCTPAPESPISLVNNPPAPGQASLSFAFGGITSDGLSRWRGVFTGQFNVPYQTLLQQYTSGGLITDTLTASITVEAIPEPTSASLLAVGLVAGLAVKLRRRKT